MKKITRIAGFAASLFALPVFAQDVPALTSPTGEKLPPLELLSPDSVKLDAKETEALRLAAKWKGNQDKPRTGPDGSVVYLFGATLPTLVCSPLEVCTIMLQPGEVVSDKVHAGDKARWKISPGTMGSPDGEVTLVIVKPTDAGLETNLTIPTNRRVYSIKLVSTQKQWMPFLSFDYPDEMDRLWAEYRDKRAKTTYNNTMPTGQNLASLDFGFKLGGDSPSWKPVRVYTDGAKTYIQFSSSSFGGDAPALVALGNDGGLFSSPSKKLVNYRAIGDRYVVDKVLDKAALIQGVGSEQTEVTITREGK
ncbi:P-type conjugative transfer protein TrbG [Pseudomonas coleopterorum]|uniref:P-type conjugative transfer protein TrbG n=1 Tax=Pseudomonas coleopterorum TaxID=1605838 RepID=UPI00177D53DF|nr:P-type conjugative transfer protein TrbG [Pseudomonas coleopterorum]MBD8483926.1 P-type conjugative transfer protein TrbG [Pseudomonas coleopterorum]